MTSDLSPFLALKKPYQAALNGDWEAMKSFYDKHPEHVVRPLTIDGLTALHIAGYSSEGTKLLQHLLSLLPPSEIPLAISKKSDHHNNVFHEVASTNNVASAKLLISELSQNNLSKLKMILEDRNQIGETSIFRAAALGQTKMVKFLAKILVGDISPHFHRHDSISILHAAVLGQHFGLSLSCSLSCKHITSKLITCFNYGLL
jgi:ankyrin repeat protein